MVRRPTFREMVFSAKRMARRGEGKEVLEKVVDRQRVGFFPPPPPPCFFLGLPVLIFFGLFVFLFFFFFLLVGIMAKHTEQTLTAAASDIGGPGPENQSGRGDARSGDAIIRLYPIRRPRGHREPYCGGQRLTRENRPGLHCAYVGEPVTTGLFS